MNDDALVQQLKAAIVSHSRAENLRLIPDRHCCRVYTLWAGHEVVVEQVTTVRDSGLLMLHVSGVTDENAVLLGSPSVFAFMFRTERLTEDEARQVDIQLKDPAAPPLVPRKLGFQPPA